MASAHNKKIFGPRALAVPGPSIWITAHATVRDPLLTYGQFCSKLKSVMFNKAYRLEQLRLRDNLL